MIDGMPRKLSFIALLAASTSTVAFAVAFADGPAAPSGVLTGKDALGDWRPDAPGVRRRITLDDLAKPFETKSANNFPRVVCRPAGAMPQAPKDFQVSEFATGFRNPRKIVT